MSHPAPNDRAFFGHPRGLSTLFFTEMWERFSYYGMRALLLLYMTAPLSAGGLGFDAAQGGAIYGLYTSMVYMTALPGGWIADRLIGQRRAVLYGGILIASGHFCMAFPSLATFYLGLFLIVLGTGLLKGNVSVIVGQLYGEKDQRRDAGFSIFYMGINLGAFIAPLICGYLGQEIGWHVGLRGGRCRHDVRRDSVPAGQQEPRRRGRVAGARRRLRPKPAALRRSAAIWGSILLALVVVVGGGAYHGSAADHREADRGRGRRVPAAGDRGLLRLAVPVGRVDAGGEEAALRHRRAVPRGGALLVGVRTGRLDAQPVRGSQYGHHAVRLRRSRARGSSRSTRCS